jgi:hypothetical protein
MSHLTAPDSDPSSAPEAAAHVWNFYLPDDDRNTGWTNHGYVLQFVCHGNGATPGQAWDEALGAGRIPDRYLIEEPPQVAIRADHELTVLLAARSPR